MTGVDADAEPGQSIGDVRTPGVGSTDLIAKIREQFRDAAHADTANPHEVHVPRPSEPAHYAAAPSARPARPNTRSTMRAAASGFAKLRIARLMTRRFAGSPRIAAASSLSRSGVSVRSSISTAAP